MRTLYCNSFEVGSSKEAFVLTFRFQSPDGKTQTFYVVLSPSGATTVHDLLSKEIEAYVKEHGNIPVGTWQTRITENCHENKQPYLS